MNRLVFHVVTRHPSDFPSHYVVRAQWPTAQGLIETAPVGCLYDSLAAIHHDYGYSGLVWMPRLPDDDPVIVGSWM